MSPPLRVPLEILERILLLAFSSPPPISFAPTYPDAFRTPPIGTSHLLLISKGVRQLALPLYYSSISIVNPIDWPTLLHPRRGLLVGKSDQAKERRSWVKTVRLNVAQHSWRAILLEYLQNRVSDGIIHNLDVSTVLVLLAKVDLPNLGLVEFFALDSQSCPCVLQNVLNWKDGHLDRLWNLVNDACRRKMDPYRKWEDADYYRCLEAAQDFEREMSDVMAEIPEVRRTSSSLLVGSSPPSYTLRIPFDLFQLVSKIGTLPPLVDPTQTLSLIILPPVLISSADERRVESEHLNKHILPFLPRTEPPLSEFIEELQEVIVEDGGVDVSRSLLRWQEAKRDGARKGRAV